MFHAVLDNLPQICNYTYTYSTKYKQLFGALTPYCNILKALLMYYGYLLMCRDLLCVPEAPAGCRLLRPGKDLPQPVPQVNIKISKFFRITILLIDELLHSFHWPYAELNAFQPKLRLAFL